MVLVKMSPLVEQTPFPLTELEGTLERLTYQNDENGYTVARLIPKGKSYEVTVVGTLAGVNVGESAAAHGRLDHASPVRAPVRGPLVSRPVPGDGRRHP